MLGFGDIMNKIKSPCFHRTHRLGVEDKQVFSSVLSDKRKSYTKTTTKNSSKNCMSDKFASKLGFC